MWNDSRIFIVHSPFIPFIYDVCRTQNDQNDQYLHRRYYSTVFADFLRINGNRKSGLRLSVIKYKRYNRFTSRYGGNYTVFVNGRNIFIGAYIFGMSKSCISRFVLKIRNQHITGVNSFIRSFKIYFGNNEAGCHLIIGGKALYRFSVVKQKHRGFAWKVQRTSQPIVHGS